MLAMHPIEQQVLDLDENEHPRALVAIRPAPHARLQSKELESLPELRTEEVRPARVVGAPANASVEEIALGPRGVAKLHVSDRAVP